MNCEKVHRAEVSTSRPTRQLPCSQDGLPGGEQIPVGERQGDVKEKKALVMKQCRANSGNWRSAGRAENET